MFSHGLISALVDHQAVRHEPDTGAGDRFWMLMHRWCAGTISPAKLLDMSFICHSDKFSSSGRLYELLRRHEKFVVKGDLDLVSLC